MGDEDREELSLEELEEAAGGAVGDNTNCATGCNNTNCVMGCTKEPVAQ